MGAFLFACLRQVPKTALGTDEQLVSQVVVVDARPFALLTTEVAGDLAHIIRTSAEMGRWHKA